MVVWCVADNDAITSALILKKQLNILCWGSNFIWSNVWCWCSQFFLCISYRRDMCVNLIMCVLRCEKLNFFFFASSKRCCCQNPQNSWSKIHKKERNVGIKKKFMPERTFLVCLFVSVGNWTHMKQFFLSVFFITATSACEQVERFTYNLRKWVFSMCFLCHRFYWRKDFNIKEQNDVYMLKLYDAWCLFYTDFVFSIFRRFAINADWGFLLLAIGIFFIV